MYRPKAEDSRDNFFTGSYCMCPVGLGLGLAI